ncbi:MAG TPA: hypothetical protein VGQ57_05905, partial [Polyangiaceae bacterium]|nr:hypothetical protein [Polyangiaceae bacterium]
MIPTRIWRSAQAHFADPNTRLERGLTLAFVLAGLALRARGYLWDTRPLWLDEATWLQILVDPNFGDADLRPPGFMAVSGALVQLFSASETVLRAVPWLAGVAVTLLAPPLGRRLFAGPAARLLFVAVLAFQPAAIDLSKEFKPYSLSLALHLALLLTVLRYLASLGARDLAVPLVIAVVGAFFSQDLVFAYPGVFLVLAGAAWSGRRKHLAAIAGAAAATVAALLGQYILIWSRIPKEESSYWAGKYSVFYSAESGVSYLDWLRERWSGVLGFPGMRRHFWEARSLSPALLDGFRSVDGVVWVLFALGGLALLCVRRRVTVLVLVALPYVVLWLFNALRFWPLGAFRTNLFTLVYTSALAAAAFDWRRESARSPAWFTAAPACLLVVAPLLLFEKNWHANKRAFAYDGHMPAALALLREARAGEQHHRPEP